MKTLGEAGTVTISSKINAKLIDKGVTCMFVGYAKNHTGDCYKMWCEANNTYYLTRDVVFLHRMYFEAPARVREISIEPMTVTIPHDNNDPTTNSASNISNDPEMTENEPNDANIEDNVDTFDDDDINEGIDNTVESDDELNEELNENNNASTGYRTQSGRVSCKPIPMYPYVSEFSGACVNNYAEMNINEVNLVGAGIGGGFEVTSELKVMNFKKAMKSDEKKK